MNNKPQRDTVGDRIAMIRLIDAKGSVSPPVAAKALGVSRQAARARLGILIAMGVAEHDGFERVYRCLSKTYKLTMPLDQALTIPRKYKRRDPALPVAASTNHLERAWF